ncbi:tetratricopeptide repeat protein [Fulvivirga maritima]|uniref:tetratricopeptide repeat protein n=1 Tax=Fulvivirga maritima TaxID=2904247 RepID=UPI001F45ACBF|nr:tetratricopeptide repeat protein [Fulvivirga maritima]UII27591.1 tetratricopeptide repeat protein [Fulvivirga maritima]
MALYLISCHDETELNTQVNVPDEKESLESMLDDDKINVESRLTIYYKLSKIYKSEDYQVSEGYANKLIFLSKEEGNKYFEARGEYMKGYLSGKVRNYDSSVKHYIIASELFKESEDYLWQADVVNNIGKVFYQIEGYESAVDYFQKAADLYKSENDWQHLSMALSNIAGCMFKLNKLDKSNFFYLQAIDAYHKSGVKSESTISDLYKDLGNVEFEKSNYDKAVQHYKKALSFTNISDDLRHSIYINIANALNYKGSFNEAINWLKKAEDLSKILSLNIDRQIKSILIKGEHYQLQNEQKKALTTFEEALSLADIEVFNENIINTLDLISKSQRALASQNAKVEINDIFRIEDLRKQQEALKSQIVDQLDYKRLQVILDTEIQNHYKEVKQSEIDKERSTIIKIASACIAIFFFTLLGTTLYIRSKKVIYETKVKKVNDLLNSDR